MDTVLAVTETEDVVLRVATWVTAVLVILGAIGRVYRQVAAIHRAVTDLEDALPVWKELAETLRRLQEDHGETVGQVLNRVRTVVEASPAAHAAAHDAQTRVALIEEGVVDLRRRVEVLQRHLDVSVTDLWATLAAKGIDRRRISLPGEPAEAEPPPKRRTSDADP